MSDKTLLIARLVPFGVLVLGFCLGVGWLFSIGTIGLGAAIGYETYHNWDTFSDKMKVVQCLMAVILIFLGVL